MLDFWNKNDKVPFFKRYLTYQVSLVVEERIRVDTIPILNERLSVYFQNHIAQSHLAKSMTTLT